MSSAFKRPYQALAAALVLATLALCGCTDHGPVGIYSKELFNKTIPPPRLDYSSASSVTFTPGPQSPSGGWSNQFSATVYIANFGNSSTYGPVLATFYANDPNLAFTLVNGNDQIVPWGTPGVLPQAVADNAPGTEIPANSSALQTLLRGYSTNGTDYIVDATDSYLATYNYPAVYTGVTHTIIVYMVLKDAIGNSWNTQFTIFVIT
jgi:hypothetical protein